MSLSEEHKVYNFSNNSTILIITEKLMNLKVKKIDLTTVTAKSLCEKLISFTESYISEVGNEISIVKTDK